MGFPTYTPAGVTTGNGSYMDSLQQFGMFQLPKSTPLDPNSYMNSMNQFSSLGTLPSVTPQLSDTGSGLGMYSPEVLDLQANAASEFAPGGASMGYLSADPTAMNVPNQLNLGALAKKFGLSSEVQARFVDGSYTDADMALFNGKIAGGGNNTDWLSDGNLKTAAVGIQGLQALGNMYMGYKGLDLAKDQFAFQKGLAEKNMANSIKNYNTELAHKAKMRYAGQKSAADIDAYVSANSL